MQGSGRTSRIASESRIGKRGSAGCEHRIEDKTKRERPEDRSLFGTASRNRLFDLAIARDLGGRGHRRSNLNLRALDLRELTGSLARGDPIVLSFFEILADVSVVKSSGL